MNLRKVIIIGIFMALSVVGAHIVIPGPTGTLALDSMPAFVLSVLIGPVTGGIAGGFAHLIDAGLKGFPYGLNVHLIVAVMMILSVTVYGYVYTKFNKYVGLVAGVIMNGPVSLIPLYFILGWGFVASMLIPLSVAAGINIIIATAVIEGLKVSLRNNVTYQTLIKR